MKNSGNNEFLPANERADICSGGSRYKKRIVDQVVGFILIASGVIAITTAGVVPARAQQSASVESLNDISELADRLYYVRESLRTVGTVSDAMAGSVLVQFCNMTEVALHGDLSAGISMRGEIQGGGGKAIPAEGDYVATTHKKALGSSASLGAKLSTIHNGCLNINTSSFDVEPGLDIGAAEDDYRYYNPPLESSSSMNRMAVSSSGDEGMKSAISNTVDVTPVELLNALADGLAAMGIDPGNEEHVRSMLLGADWIEPANSFVGLFEGNPLESAFGAISSIQNLAGVFPIVGDFMTNSLDSILNVVELGEPCGILVNAGIFDDCDAVDSFARDMSRFFYDGLRLIQDIPGTFDEISGGVSGVADGIHNLNKNLSTGAYQMSRVLNRIDNIDGNMTKNINRVNGLPNAVGELEGAYEDVKNRWSDFHERNCKTLTRNHAIWVKPFIGVEGYCAVDLAINPCVVEPEVKAQMQCDADFSGLEDMFGQAYEEVNDFIKNMSRGLSGIGDDLKNAAEEICFFC